MKKLSNIENCWDYAYAEYAYVDKLRKKRPTEMKMNIKKNEYDIMN